MVQITYDSPSERASHERRGMADLNLADSRQSNGSSESEALPAARHLHAQQRKPALVRSLAAACIFSGDILCLQLISLVGAHHVLGQMHAEMHWLLALLHWLMAPQAHPIPRPVVSLAVLMAVHMHSMPACRTLPTTSQPASSGTSTSPPTLKQKCETWTRTCDAESWC